jgi:hypothetical protein
MGPGDYWLAQGLKGKGCQFTYQPFSTQVQARGMAKELLGHLYTEEEPTIMRWIEGDQETETHTKPPNIFVACEIIEHLWNPHEIAQTADKLKTIPERLVFSTPLYTFGPGNETWRDEKNRGKLGHIRTFTPNEFMTEIRRMFNGYEFTLQVSEVMGIEGVLNA